MMSRWILISNEILWYWYDIWYDNWLISVKNEFFTLEIDSELNWFMLLFNENYFNLENYNFNWQCNFTIDLDLWILEMDSNLINCKFNWTISKWNYIITIKS